MSCGAARRSTCAVTSPATPASPKRRPSSASALAYARIGEYHKRGLVHIHALVRLDRAMPEYRREQLRPPDAMFTVEVLEQAIRSAVAEVHAKGSKYLGSPRVRWGEQVDVRPLSDRGELGA